MSINSGLVDSEGGNIITDGIPAYPTLSSAVLAAGIGEQIGELLEEQGFSHNIVYLGGTPTNNPGSAYTVVGFHKVIDLSDIVEVTGAMEKLFGYYLLFSQFSDHEISPNVYRDYIDHLKRIAPLLPGLVNNKIESFSLSAHRHGDALYNDFGKAGILPSQIVNYIMAQLSDESTGGNHTREAIIFGGIVAHKKFYQNRIDDPGKHFHSNNGELDLSDSHDIIVIKNFFLRSISLLEAYIATQEIKSRLQSAGLDKKLVQTIAEGRRGITNIFAQEDIPVNLRLSASYIFHRRYIEVVNDLYKHGLSPSGVYQGDTVTN